jgi:plasmid stabilization system protein ParE
VIRVIITPQARRELDRIWAYIDEDNPKRAITFVRELAARCKSLKQMPLRHPLLPLHEDSGIRSMPHGNYSIFYRYAEDTVYVLHILSAAQDHEAILFPDAAPGH